jgi:hypothetical protein
MEYVSKADHNYIAETKEIIFERFGKSVIYTEDEIVEQVDVFVAEQLEKGRIPTIGGFVLHLKVSNRSFNKRKSNSQLLEQVSAYILSQQKEETIQSGFVAKNSRFHEFILNVNHGMKVEDTSNPTVNISLQNPEVVRRLKNIERKMNGQGIKDPTIVDVSEFELIE